MIFIALVVAIYFIGNGTEDGLMAFSNFFALMQGDWNDLANLPSSAWTWSNYTVIFELLTKSIIVGLTAIDLILCLVFFTINQDNINTLRNNGVDIDNKLAISDINYKTTDYFNKTTKVAKTAGQIWARICVACPPLAATVASIFDVVNNNAISFAKVLVYFLLIVLPLIISIIIVKIVDSSKIVKKAGLISPGFLYLQKRGRVKVMFSRATGRSESYAWNDDMDEYMWEHTTRVMRNRKKQNRMMEKSHIQYALIDADPATAKLKLKTRIASVVQNTAHMKMQVHKMSRIARKKIRTEMKKDYCYCVGSGFLDGRAKTRRMFYKEWKIAAKLRGWDETTSIIFHGNDVKRIALNTKEKLGIIHKYTQNGITRYCE